MSCRSGPWSAWWTARCSAATPTAPSTAASPSFSRSTIESHKQIRSIVRQQQNWQKIPQCMSIAYRQKLTSPKWNRFLGMKLRWKDKIRLNNVIWRCWHMQFIKVIINITINITIIIASTSANIIINTMTPGTQKACVRVCQPSGDWQPQQDWGGSHHGGWQELRWGFKNLFDHEDCWIWLIRKQSVDVSYHTGEILEEKDGNYIGWIQEVEVNNYIVISLWLITL